MNLRESSSWTRRQLFKDSATGWVRLATSRRRASRPGRGQADSPVLAPAATGAPQAKNIIYHRMAGPPRLSTCSFQAKLNQLMASLPRSRTSGASIRVPQGKPKLLGSPHRFAREIRPGDVGCAALATVTGSQSSVRCIPTSSTTRGAVVHPRRVGAAGAAEHGVRLSYGRDRNRDLPSFVAGIGDRLPTGVSLWAAPSLPTVHQGCNCGRREIGALPSDPAALTATAAAVDQHGVEARPKPEPTPWRPRDLTRSRSTR